MPSRQVSVSFSPIVVASFVVVFGIFAAFGSAYWVDQRNHERASERFDALVSRIALQISDRLSRYEYGLRGVRGAIIAAGDVGMTREIFRRYSLSRDITQEFPGARGFGFIRRVPLDAEAALVRRAQADGAPTFSVRQLIPQSGERFVIEYIEPVETNREAVGLDVASEQHRKAAAIAALESGRATLTAPITLVQATGMPARGFLLFLPVLRADAPAKSPEARRAATVGWTYAPLIIDEVLSGLDLEGDRIDLSLADRTSERVVSFFSNASADRQLPATDTLQQTRAVQIFGRTWVLQAAATPGFRIDLNLTPPIVVGLTILAVALLIAGLVYLRLAGHRREALAGVEKSRLAAIVTDTSDAIIAKSLDGIITDWNPAAERLFGYSAAEAVGCRAADLIVPPHLHAEEDEVLARVRDGLSVPSLTTQRRRRDGRLLPMRISISPIRAPDGTPAGAAITAHDISEQLAAEERIQGLNATLEQQVAERTAQLHDSSALQSAILSNAGYAVIATDLDGTITLFNPAAERLLGYSAGELVGAASPGVFHDPEEVVVRARSVSSELGHTVEPGFDVFVARTRRGLPNVAEWTYVTKTGKRLPVLLNVSSLRSEDGRDIGFLGIASDLTERHRHEAELKAADAGTWKVDVGSGRVWFSAETARQHDLPEQPVELDIERDWAPLVHTSDAPRARADLQAAIEARGSLSTEFRVRLRDGSVRWITAIGEVETDATGAPLRVVGLSLDITARKEAELALEAAKATAERASQAKTDFLAAMSHEIRTPLNAIIGFTDLMVGSGRLDADMQRQAELVRVSGAALLTVVNDILDFSKVEAGAIELLREPFPPHTLVDNCLSIVRSLAVSKGLEVSTAIDTALPPALLGDQGRLRQVLLNLLNNAVKFTKSGSVTLTVRHEGTSAAGERLCFAVKDTGIGISQEKQARLFQRFSQVDGSIQRDYGGTGLGLAISKHLVELMGGEVGVLSQEGRGSTFWFVVTLQRASLADPLAPVTLSPVPRRQGYLLLVEDVAINQELARTVLQVAGHRVDVVGNGADAVVAVGNARYDLVLMDVQMPGMDGMTATRAIRSLGIPASRVPIIAMTANVLPDQVRSFRDAGMDDHVGKPFNRAELYATIDKWLSGKSESAEPDELEGIAAAFDRSIYEDMIGLLRPGRVVGILTSFLGSVESSFSEPVETFEDRSRIRHAAHALSSSAGMIGFSDLSVACHLLEISADDEQDGRESFETALVRVRALATAAAIQVRQLIIAAGRDVAPRRASAG